MATQDRSSYAEGFGQVSRTVGTVFRYLLLASTLFGIAVLAILLVYVANDAVQPLTADPGWHLTFFLTLVLPTLATAGYLAATNLEALKFGSMTIGLIVVSLLFSGGVAIIFIEVLAPLVWFAYVLAFAVPTVLMIALQRRSRQLSFLTRFVVVALAFYTSLFGLPGVVPSVAALVQSAPFVPLDWVLLTLTLGLFASAPTASYAAGIRDRRTGLGVGVLALAAVAASPFIGPPVFGIGTVPSVILASVTVVPTVAFVGGTAVTREHARIGILVPLLIVGGALAGEVLVDTLGYAGPQSWVDWQFLTSDHSGTAEDAGLYPAIAGSILLMVTVAALSFPVGVGAALYLEEYAPDNRITRFIDVNISNLAGVPSVVYGLLGLGLFVTQLGRPSGTIFVGGATLALLILPIVIISSREAIRSVPDEMRQASYGMGATKWQTVKNVILPRAFPGILTGTILALGRAIGETAPLIMIGAPNVLFSFPSELSSKVSAMPLQVYSWASYFATDAFYEKAVPAGVVILVTVLLAMNSIAIVLRNRYEQET
ncbi:phosphate ABC transporter permease PstA [Haloarchaeobius iranensis]|uniref:Phosphate transport system permease protein PstA n=1 Tax=Haloarchaeobius iranensis TaxID=996166 RepID=A0A1G9X6D3_9EURY|nr:phosphate ABC transporter permease PstA [Haloarchaeobius iranensis]SDM91903.1 phosphate ABC transporter membrane protein 2, PhoT family [Haloarchaeobius iranensis]